MATTSKDVVIYDGNCAFCQGKVASLVRWDGGGRLEFLSLHDAEAARRYPDLSHNQLMAQIYVIDICGRRHGGHAALRYLSRRLPRLWPVAPLLHLPLTGPVWAWLYRQVARRRYGLSDSADSGSGVCSTRRN